MTTLPQLDGQTIDGLIFCKMVYTLFEDIIQSNEGVSRIRLRGKRANQTEKKLIEELLPICKFIHLKYRPGRYLSIKWINGNQQYDAELQQQGKLITQGYYPVTSYIESTTVMHKNDFLQRELLDTQGYTFGLEGISRSRSGQIESKATSYHNLEFIEIFSKLLIKGISKKLKLNYPQNTTLLVECFLNTIYTQDEWNTLILNVEQNIKNDKFQEILIFDSSSEKHACIYIHN
ncbi:MAG TPA: hypothetical protein VGJ90_12415 [Methylophilaceae bacterium]|jgi:hypothetical protein